MATRTVQPKQTVASLAKTNNISEDDFYLANPGVKTLRPGQVIKVPNPPRGSPTTNGFTTTGYTGTAGYWGAYNNPTNKPLAEQLVGSRIYNLLKLGETRVANIVKGNPPTAQTAGYGMQGTPLTPSQANFQTPTTNGFTTPGYTNLTPSQSQNIPRPAPYLGASSYLNPALQTPTQSQNIPAAQTSQAQTGIPPRPEGVYTGDPNDPNTAIWKARWEWEARNPRQAQEQAIILGLYNTPKVMSRDQIWQMKAEQRRRRAEQGDGQTSSGSYNYPTDSEQGNAPLVRTITWGI